MLDQTYVLILPWNLRDEIVEKMAIVRSWGGRLSDPSAGGHSPSMTFLETPLLNVWLIESEFCRTSEDTSRASTARRSTGRAV